MRESIHATYIELYNNLTRPKVTHFNGVLTGRVWENDE